MSVLQQVRSLAKTRHGNDLQRAFKRFDLNQDRQLTAKELLAALLSLGVTTGTALRSPLLASCVSRWGPWGEWWTFEGESLSLMSRWRHQQPIPDPVCPRQI